MHGKPFYTKWKGRQKARAAELCSAGRRRGLSLYLGLLQELHDVFKEHRPSQAELIQS